MIDNWRFVCPRCSRELSGAHPCRNCGAEFAVRDGIHRFLLPERLAAIQPFLAQYRLVRERDGYRSRPPEYYRSLPYVHRRDPQWPVWRVRAESFATLRQWMDRTFGERALSILDLGAGNGWLAHRLTLAGHRLAATDWLDDADDGLGAAVHYPTEFTRAQADFDDLPFAAGQFDLVVFNASLHYSPDIGATLHRARAMLGQGGALAVIDSPTFRRGESGQAMVADMQRRFESDYGLQGVIWPGVGFVTDTLMQRAGCELGIDFRFAESRGGLSWRVRRWVGSMRLGREAARFGVWAGVPVDSSPRMN